MGLTKNAALQKLATETEKLVANRLRLARESEGIEQKDAARLFGISESRWGGYERKDRAAPLWLVHLFPGKFRGRTLYWLFGLPDPRGLDEREARIIERVRAIENPAFREMCWGGIEGQIAAVIAQGQASSKQAKKGEG